MCYIINTAVYNLHQLSIIWIRWAISCWISCSNTWQFLLSQFYACCTIYNDVNINVYSVGFFVPVQSIQFTIFFKSCYIYTHKTCIQSLKFIYGKPTMAAYKHMHTAHTYSQWYSCSVKCQFKEKRVKSTNSAVYAPPMCRHVFGRVAKCCNLRGLP